MDQIELDLTQQNAGAEYLTSLESLGLQVDALFWTFDRLEQRFVLVLATEMFDFKGPLAVSEMLFKAYNLSATPQEIDPFVVRLHSPNHSIIRALDGWKATDPDGIARYGLAAEQKSRPPTFAEISVTVEDLNYRSAWVYRFRLPKVRKTVELTQRWNRFERNVDLKAAA